LAHLEAQGELMKVVYILQSESDAERFYVGVTNDIDRRLGEHNEGKLPNTARYCPWKVRTYVTFSDDALALAFEKYLKSGSGRAFAKKRL
jgi:putative endonuclease